MGGETASYRGNSHRKRRWRSTNQYKGVAELRQRCQGDNTHQPNNRMVKTVSGCGMPLWLPSHDHCRCVVSFFFVLFSILHLFFWSLFCVVSRVEKDSCPSVECPSGPKNSKNQRQTDEWFPFAVAKPGVPVPLCNQNPNDVKSYLFVRWLTQRQVLL